jgi:hypothetical protein
MVAALDHADKMLKRGRSGVPKVMMMLTDGEPNRGGNPDANFAAMKAAGTSVMMVLIGPGISSRRAKNWGSTPPISISSFTALSSAFTTISKEFCSVAKEAVKKAKTPAPTIAPPKIPTSCECHMGTAVIPQANAACPKGFKPTGKPCPGGGTCCGAGWTKSCGEGCAKAKCDAFKGEWIPLDYKTNPYTCETTGGDVKKVVETILACDHLLEQCLWMEDNADYPSFGEMYCYMDGDTKYGGAARCCTEVIKAGLKPNSECKYNNPV